MDEYWEAWVPNQFDSNRRLFTSFEVESDATELVQAYANDCQKTGYVYHVLWSTVTILGITLIARRTTTQTVITPV